MTNTSRRYSDIFAIASFVRNASFLSARSPGNTWISHTLGKIGAIQHNCYTPEDFETVMSDMHATNFRAIVRVAQELSPGRNSGVFLFHPIAVIKKSDYRIFNASAFATNLDNATAILTLIDSDLDSSVLWGVNAETKGSLLRDLQANAVLPNVAKAVRRMAITNSNIAHALEKSDKLVSFAEAV